MKTVLNSILAAILWAASVVNAADIPLPAELLPVDPAAYYLLVDTRLTGEDAIVGAPKRGEDMFTNGYNNYPVGWDTNYNIVKIEIPEPPQVDGQFYQVTRLPSVLDMVALRYTSSWSQARKPNSEIEVAIEGELGSRHRLIGQLINELMRTRIAFSVLWNHSVNGQTIPVRLMSYMNNRYLPNSVKLYENWVAGEDLKAGDLSTLTPEAMRAAFPHPEITE